MSQPNQPPTGPTQPYGQQPPQSQYTPPPPPQDPYRGSPTPSEPYATPGEGSPGDYGPPGGYSGQQVQPQPGMQPAPGGQGGYETTAPQYSTAKRSGTLGVIALVLAVLAAILYLVFSVLSGQATVDLARMSGGTIPSDPDQISQAATEKTMAAAGFMLAQVVPSLLGLGGLICGIVSAASGRGRAFGVIAIVLAVLAPIVAFIVYGVIVAPVVQ